MRGADLLAKCLKDAGTETIFALSGNQIMSVFDACLDTSIRLVHTRHEAAAAFMAEGYAQISGKPGIALVTAGAGLGNAIAPLMTARASQTPLLLLSGDSPAGLDGKGAFQEMDQVALTASLTKMSRRIETGEDMAEAVHAAFKAALSGQPGPVHLSLPADVLEQEVGNRPVSDQAHSEDTPDVSEIIALLNEASHPMVLLGPELNQTRFERDLSSLGVPALAMESPRGARDPSLGRFGQAWETTDLVVVLGKPVDFSLGFGSADHWPNARWVTVHGDAAEMQRATRNLGDRLVSSRLGAPRQWAEALLQRSGEIANRSEWSVDVSKLCAARPGVERRNGAITSAMLGDTLNATIQNSASPIFVADGGEIGQWAQALVSAPRRVINGVAGAIGGGLCYAIGAKAASPASDVFVCMGDGTVGFHLAEFETAVRENLPFVAVIGNDQRWNAEHELQRRNFGEDRTHGCTLSAARYDEAVTALGGFGAHVTQPSELADALSDALASGKPACVNVEIESQPAPAF